MSLNYLDLLKDVREHIERHRNIYSLADVVSEGRLAKKSDGWYFHNRNTTIMILNSGSSRPWQQHASWRKLSISCTVTVDSFLRVLENLINKYSSSAQDNSFAFQPRFSPMALVGSDRAGKLFKLDFGVCTWQTVEKKNMPRGCGDLKIVSDEHRGGKEAIQDYLSQRNCEAGLAEMLDTAVDRLLVLTPMYYAKIDRVVLGSYYEIHVAVKRYNTNVEQLRLRCVAEKWAEGRRQWFVGDDKTVPVEDREMQKVVVKIRPERAKVSLHHVEGYEIDSCTVKNSSLAWDRLGRATGNRELETVEREHNRQIEQGRDQDI